MTLIRLWLGVSGGTNLINVQFGDAQSISKTGSAAFGFGAGDFWNLYSRDGVGGYLNAGSISNLEDAFGNPTGVSLTILNAPGAWGNGSPDPMFGTYLYPFTPGIPILVAVSNLSVGRYDLYLYGHGSPATLNTAFAAVASGVQYPTLKTLTDANWISPLWVEGEQYVVERGVVVAHAGDVVQVSASADQGSVPVISGLQIVGVDAAVPPSIGVSPAAGTYTNQVSVALTGVNLPDGAEIHFTLDGTSPSENSALYTGAILLTNTTTTSISAAIFVNDQIASEVSVATYSVITVVPPGTGGTPNLINIQFGVKQSVAKVGGAGFPGTANDLWNLYSRDGTAGTYLNLGTLQNLAWADGTVSPVSLVVSNAPGAWGSGSTDSMMGTYLYPLANSGNIGVWLSALPTGTYDVYLYGHGGPAIEQYDSAFTVRVGGTSYPTLKTGTDGNWLSSDWIEGEQYVVERGVVVQQPGDILQVIVASDAYPLPALNGLQLVQTSTHVPPRVELNPSPEPFKDSEVVSITGTSLPQNGEIRYTLDGTVPTSTSSLYSGPLILTNSTTVSAVVFVGDSMVSAVAAGTYTLEIPGTNSVGAVINVQFGDAESTVKTGTGAYPGTDLDFWNLYSRDGAFGYQMMGSLSNLKFTDGTTSTVGLVISNAPGAWGNGSSDPMFGTYLYPFAPGSSIVVVLTNVPVGAYDLYLYGHGGPNLDSCNSVFSVSASQVTYPALATTTNATWLSTPWTEGQQYVVERGVVVATNGDSIQILVGPGGYSVPALSGLQLVLNQSGTQAAVQVAPVGAGVSSGMIVSRKSTTGGALAGTRVPEFDRPLGESLKVAMTALGLPSGAEIRYTLDGSAPTSTSAIYTGPVTLNASAVVSAAAFLNGQRVTHVSIAHYNLDGTTKSGAGSLINVQFADQDTERAAGKAIIGFNSSDQWNLFTPGLAAGHSINLNYADGTTGGAFLSVAVPVAPGTNGSGDPLFGRYVTPTASGANLTAEFSHLVPGVYDLFVSGHAAPLVGVSGPSLTVQAAGVVYPRLDSATNSPNSPLWTEGQQYLARRGVVVGTNGQLQVTVSPGASSAAAVSAIQLLHRSDSVDRGLPPGNGGASSVSLSVVGFYGNGGQRSFVLQWSSVPGTGYRLLKKADLSDTNWTEVAEIQATGTQTAYSESVATNGVGYYTVVMAPE